MKMYKLFLPEGYPDSVTEDYFAYQIYDSFQAIFSTLTGLLITKLLLKSYGVGDAEASATSATLVFISRDVMSMLTKICFAHFCSGGFKHNVKGWRFAADIINDLGYLVDFLATIVPKDWFIWVAGVSAAIKSCVGVCGTATRMSLTLHFCKWNNEADVSAKDGSQETIINLVGTFLGWILISWLGDNPTTMVVAWLLFLFIFAHLMCNYFAVCGVVLGNLNQERTLVLLRHFIQNRNILTPAMVAKSERILWPLFDKQVVFFTRVGDGYRVTCGNLSVNTPSSATSSELLKTYMTFLLHSRLRMPYDECKELCNMKFVNKVIKAGWDFDPHHVM